MKDDIVLYDYEGSPCARRVKVFLIEKGLPFRVETINLSKMEQKSPEYLRINPNGLVPALSHNGRVIFESSVINEYLEDRFPKIRIVPRSVEGKISAKKWENFELSMANVYRPLMYARFMGPLHHVACTKDEFVSISAQATDNPAYLAWQEKVWGLKVLSVEEQHAHQKQLSEFVDLVERSLENREYLVGNRFSSADVSVYPRLTMIPLIGIKINSFTYPNVTAWIERIGKRRSFRTTFTESEKKMGKLRDFGVIELINRIVYKDSAWSMKDKVVLKVLGRVIRKSLGIEASLNGSAQQRRQFMTSTPRDNTPSMPTGGMELDQISTKEPLMIYGFSGSPICDRLATLCRLLDVDYTHIEVDMRKMEHTKPPYKYLNPANELPLLLHGDTVVHDSLFIAEYLCHYADAVATRNHRYFSEDSLEQADIRMWNAFDMGMRKEYRPIFFAHINHEAIDPLERSRCLSVLSEKVDHLERSLEGKAYLVADRVTYADLLLYTRLESFRTLGIDECFSSSTNIHEWMARVAVHIRGEDAPKQAKKKRKAKAITP